MSYFPNPFAPPPHFLLESLELLLARLGQLSHHVRDTVARIIGSTVAEAVPEALQFAMRRLPGRRAPFVRERPWPPDVDPYDYLDDDPVSAERSYPPLPHATTHDDWRGPWRALTGLLAQVGRHCWHWAVAHRGRVAVAVIFAMFALFVARSQFAVDA